MKIGVDTNDFSVSERLQAWRQGMCESYVGIDCDAANEDFRVVITGYRVGDYSITRGTSSGHRVERSRSLIQKDRAERVYVGLTLAGRSVMCQAGREAVLEPGTFAFNDTTRPFHSNLGEDSDIIWLGIPKQPLADRIRGLEDLTAVSFLPARPIQQVAADLLAGLDDALARKLPPHEADTLIVRVLDLLALTVATGAIVAEGAARPRSH